MNKIKISVALIGARMHYAVPMFLYKKGYLNLLYTDLYAKDNVLNFFKFLNKKIYKVLLLRKSNDLPDSQVKSFYIFGVKYRINKYMTRIFQKSLGKLWVWAGTDFNKAIIIDITRSEIKTDIVYGYNCASKELFEYCKDKKIITILEQCSAPMAYENSIMQEEYNLYHDWEINLYIGNMNCEEFINKETDEWGLADLIIAPSQYVKQALLSYNISNEKIQVVPYGYDTVNIKTVPPKKNNTKILNVLYVGALRLQKGIQYFYKLSEELPKEHFEFRAVGESFLQEKMFSKINNSINIIGKVARDDMHMQYNWADVLIVPSLSEGSATVIYEALSYGVPVICTENSGSVITNGKDGFVVEIRNTEKMKKYLLTMKNNDLLLQELKINAKQTSSCYTVEEYGSLLIDTIQNFYDQKGNH